MNAGIPFYTILICVSTFGTAWAYVDPNVGGSIFQILMPILAVLLGFIAFAWNFVKKNFIALFKALCRGGAAIISRSDKKENS